MQLPFGVVNELIMGQEGQAAKAFETDAGRTSWALWIKNQLETHQNGFQWAILTFTPSHLPSLSESLWLHPLLCVRSLFTDLGSFDSPH